MQSTKKISTVSIIGSGNVATALGIALSKAGIKILEVYSPNPDNSKLLAEKVGSGIAVSIEELNIVSDLYIIATPDTEISNVVSKFKNIEGIVTHTSGSQPSEILGGNIKSYGVFYPVQTFTKNKIVDFKKVPICIEGSDETISQLLVQLANKISNNVVLLSSNQRQYLHLCAVTVNNFTNLMYNIAHDVLNDEGIDFSLLHPLIEETATKISEVNPAEAQTGPARRNDISTINKQLLLLAKHPEFKKIYKLLSDQIIKKHGPKTD
ncbi:MAG: DUF2520 domain-containing protein [Bacteroidetes bacterium]|nr:DUF2520 domain-containing protein [Bacteroidota bacterium]MBL6944326.1 DUF2520 domain-containing protein [Bacteroidales bacterium]